MMRYTELTKYVLKYKKEFKLSIIVDYILL